jgi:cell wall-associated NlpC family hydrolase
MRLTIMMSAMLISGLISGCGSRQLATQAIHAPSSQTMSPGPGERGYFVLDNGDDASEVVMYALGLLGTGYTFGGRNPEAGLDCSGMVSYIVEQVSGRRLPHNAASIAQITRPIAVSELRPGDLVFFNTLNRRHSHMGIYMGEGRFVHAPSSRGQVRVESLHNSYFRPRIDGARTLIASN